ALILGYGLIILALGDQFEPRVTDLSSAFFLAGSCLVTFGPSGFNAVGGGARVVLLATGVSGVVVVALLISLMFAGYGQLHQREALIRTLDARAGTTPSGVTLLETCATLALWDDLPAALAAWESWCAALVETHAAYPMLPYFRSSGRNQSWITALGAVLDA